MGWDKNAGIKKKDARNVHPQEKLLRNNQLHCLSQKE